MTDLGPRSPSGFRSLGERIIHEGIVFKVVSGEFETPDGQVVQRDIVRHMGAVSVVPVVGDEVILVRQYRAAADKEMLELPAGKRDIVGEPPETTAKRELIEEIGYSTRSLVQLATFYNSVGFSDEYSYVFLATELEKASINRQGPEEQHMTIERLALDEVAAAIASGQIEDAKTVIGLMMALRYLGR